VWATRYDREVNNQSSKREPSNKKGETAYRVRGGEERLFRVRNAP